LLTRSGDSLTGSGFDQFNSRPLTYLEVGSQFAIQLYHHAAITATDLHSLRGLKVLDIGCGKGGGLEFLADYFQPSMTLGVDCSPQTIAYAK
jgi:ubiquinone/menaquinone biosynthesis C-methylase UbiE